MPLRQRSMRMCRHTVRVEGEDRPILRSIEAPNRALVIGDTIRMEWAGTWPVYRIISIEDGGAFVLRPIASEQDPGST